LTISKAKTT